MLTSDCSQLATQLLGRIEADEDTSCLLVEARQRTRMYPLSPTLRTSAHPVLWTAYGRAESTDAIAMSSDKRKVITGHAGYKLKEWDAQQGTECRTIAESRSGYSCVELGPDDKWLIAGTGTNLELWELEGYSRIRTMTLNCRVQSVAVSADGCFTIVGSSDGRIFVWEADTGNLVWEFCGHDEPIYAVSVSPESNRVLAGSADKTITAWCLHSGRELLRQTAHNSWVSSAAIAPDGIHVMSGSGDGTLIRWRLDSGEVEWSAEAHSGAITGIAIAQQGNHSVTGSYDSLVKVWGSDGQLLGNLNEHRSPVHCLVIAQDGSAAVSGGYDGSIIKWDLDTMIGHNPSLTQSLSPQLRHARAPHPNRTTSSQSFPNLVELYSKPEPIRAVWITPDGHRAVAVVRYQDHGYQVWDIAERTKVHDFATIGSNDFHGATVLSRDANFAVSGFCRKLVVWDVGRDRQTCSYKVDGHKAWVRAAAISPDRSFAISCCDDAQVRVWNLATGESYSLSLPTDSANGTLIHISPNGERAMVTCPDATLLWHIATKEVLAAIKGIGGSILLPLPELETAFCGTPEGLIECNLETEEVVREFVVPPLRIRHRESHSLHVFRPVAFSRDHIVGVGAALSGDGEGILVWKRETSGFAFELDGHSDRITEVIASPTGDKCLSASHDYSLRLWDSSRWLATSFVHRRELDELLCTLGIRWHCG